MGREVIPCVLKPFKQTPGCYASSAMFQLPKYVQPRASLFSDLIFKSLSSLFRRFIFSSSLNAFLCTSQSSRTKSLPNYKPIHNGRRPTSVCRPTQSTIFRKMGAVERCHRVAVLGILGKWEEVEVERNCRDNGTKLQVLRFVGDAPSAIFIHR
jgi:hypothetical protein